MKDPTIIQLKQTLISFNTRVDSIESSNQHRFGDIERQIELCRLETQQQIQLSQASITALFTQGFENLTLKVTDQIKKSEIPQTLTTPLPEPSPSISIHQTPTTTARTPSEVTHNRKKVTSPDPPKITPSIPSTPKTRIRNPYSTPKHAPVSNTVA